VSQELNSFKKPCRAKKNGLGSNIGHDLFVGWVESARGGLGFSAGGPTYLPAIFMLSAKPNKMAEDRTIAKKSECLYFKYMGLI
jgi:hypothetical protein